MTKDTKLFKECMSKFATGVTIITTTFNNQNIGVTINSFNSVSLSPLLILFSINKKSYHYNAVANCKNFTVNILGKHQEKLVELFASHKNEQWADLKLDTLNATTTSPAIKGCQAFLECVIDSKHDGGDHTIIVGRVLNLFSNNHCEPLIYYQGKFLNTY